MSPDWKLAFASRVVVDCVEETGAAGKAAPVMRRLTNAKGSCHVYHAHNFHGAMRTIVSVVKKSRPTAPMFMYQHSRSGVSIPGR
jgi:hypothetical protein